MILVKKIKAEEAYIIRQRMLRPNMPLEASAFPGDDKEPNAHFGAYHLDSLIGVASVFLEPKPGTALTNSFRLRGMAVLESHQNLGIGKRLVQQCERYCISKNATLIWCNARTPSVRFYEKLGYETEGLEFELPGIGPHFVMSKALVDS